MSAAGKGGNFARMGSPGLIDRLRALDPRRTDILIALVLTIVLQLQFAIGNGSGPPAVNAIGGLLLTLPLAWRRRAPLAMVCVFVAAAIANEALDGGLFSFHASGTGSDPPPPFASLVSGAVAFYSLGAHAKDRAAVAGLFVGVAGLWATVIVSDQLDVASFVFSGGLVAVTPWLLGRNTRSRSQRLAVLEREQEQRTRLAVSDERARIAREFHDVVAHSVGVMVVQAEGARTVLERDPDRAREALDSIEQTGRGALAEMRRSLGVLRRDGSEATLEPQPGMDDLDGLLEHAREGGLTVEVVLEGEPRPLPQGVDLSAYRIVQEALTNTIKHAGPVRTRITVRYGERELGLEVSDDGPGPSANGAEGASGLGLVGMRERVSSYGGELRTGAGPEGGFVVRASLPLGT